MREFAPVIFDATHSVQMPASGGASSSGGDASFVPYLSRAAAAVGVDGFFFETHFDPSIALSDGPNMIELTKLDALIKANRCDQKYSRINNSVTSKCFSINANVSIFF